MSHMRPYSISNALYRVFIRPAIGPEERRSAQYAVHRTFVPALHYSEKLSKRQREKSGLLTAEDEERIRRAQEKKRQKELTKAPVARKTPLPFIPGITAPKKEQAVAKQTPDDALPTNAAIQDVEISVVDQAGNYTRRARTRDVLRSLDLSVERLQMIKRADAANERSLAVCKIESLAAVAQREREKLSKTAVKEKGARSKKEVEITWTISAGDLDVKTRQIRRFLLERRRVEVTFVKKWRRKPLGMEPSQLIQLVDGVRTAAKAISGVQEPTKPDGKLGEELMIVFDGANVQPEAESASDEGSESS